MREESIVSEKDWERLLRTGLKSNGLFPQSFFAQGIMLAADTNRMLLDTGISLSKFEVQNPPHEVVVSTISSGRKAFHKSYGIETGIDSPDPEKLAQVWKNDRRQAKTILISFTRLVNDDNAGGRETKILSSVSDERFHQVQKEPVFHGLLTTASAMMNSDTLKELATEYKKDISNFMKDYMPYAAERIIPSSYQKDHLNLLRNLREILNTAAIKTKAGLCEYLREEHPDRPILERRIALSGIEDIFGVVKVESFNPLRRLLEV